MPVGSAPVLPGYGNTPPVKRVSLRGSPNTVFRSEPGGRDRLIREHITPAARALAPEAEAAPRPDSD